MRSLSIEIKIGIDRYLLERMSFANKQRDKDNIQLIYSKHIFGRKLKQGGFVNKKEIDLALFDNIFKLYDE